MKAKKWILSVLCLALASLTFLASVSFFVDPLMFYRKSDRWTYFYHNRFSAAGLIKNGKYDAVIIGSSMTQNYDLPYMRETLGIDPIKLNVGAMLPDETLMLYQKVQSRGKAKSFIINIDINRFNVSPDLEPAYGHFPDYLLNDKISDDFKYLLGYETLTRFLPATVLLSVTKATGHAIPESLRQFTDPDRIGEWYTERTFSAEKVLNSLKKKKEDFAAENEIGESIDDIRAGTAVFIDTILSQLKEDQNVVFVMPPRSAVFWAKLSEPERETLHQIKEIFYDCCKGDARLRLVDMTAAEVITELEHYSDTSHFDLYVQNKIVDAIKSGEYDATSQSLAEGRQLTDKAINDVLERAGL